MTLSTRKTSWRANRAVLRHVYQTLRHRVREIQAEADDDFARSFNHMVAAVEAGLRHEETLLEGLGDRHLRERRAENAIILCALHRVASAVEQGQVEPGRQLTAALEQMLALHRLSSVLAPASELARFRLLGRAAGSRIRAFPGHMRHFH
jgi:hemerythrin